MQPDVVSLIQTVLLEAIKILGPAVVAAYAAYKAASVQLEVKLQELTKGNEFKAREAIFLHLKERLVHIDEQNEKLNSELGRMLGFAAGYQGGSGSEPTEYVDIMGRAVQSIARISPVEVSATLNDMRHSSLASTEEFKALSERQAIKFDTSEPYTYEALKSNVLQLIETYDLLGMCNRLLLQKQMERAFSPYVGERE